MDREFGMVMIRRCLACGNLLAEGERDLCAPCAAVMADDLAQRDHVAGHPGSRCTAACGYCGRCGDV
jgi:hypothetical protein